MQEGVITLPTPTQKEKEVVAMLKKGMNGDEISKKLKINKNTLAFNLRIIRSRYGCKNTTHLVAVFIENKLLD